MGARPIVRGVRARQQSLALMFALTRAAFVRRSCGVRARAYGFEYVTR